MMVVVFKNTGFFFVFLFFLVTPWQHGLQLGPLTTVGVDEEGPDVALLARYRLQLGGGGGWWWCRCRSSFLRKVGQTGGLLGLLTCWTGWAEVRRPLQLPIICYAIWKEGGGGIMQAQQARLTNPPC